MFKTDEAIPYGFVPFYLNYMLGNSLFYDACLAWAVISFLQSIILLQQMTLSLHASSDVRMACFTQPALARSA